MAATPRPRRKVWDMPTGCVIYTRVSSEKQAAGDKVSLPKQERLCREYAGRMGWELAGCYSDPGISGTKWEERPGFQALLADAAAGKFSVLVVYDQDRAARANEGFSRLALEMKRYGLLLACVNGGITDLRNPTEELTYTVKGAVATFDAQNLVRRMAEARAEYAAGGRWGQATYILGYHWNRELKRPVLDEREAGIVSEVFRLAADLLPCDTIAADLNKRGLVARGSRDRSPTWWGGMVSDMLVDRRYCGEWFTAPGVEVVPEYAPCRILRDADGKPQRDVADRLIVEPAPAIVTPEQWRVAQATVVVHQKLRRPIGSMTGRFLLAGLIRCGRCGARMTTRFVEPKSGGQYPYYVCVRHRPRHEGRCDLPSLNAKALDVLVWAEIAKLWRDPELVTAAAELTKRKNLERWQAEEKAAYGQIKSCRLRVARVRAAYEAGTYDLPTLQASLRDIAEEEAAAEERGERARALREDEEDREAGIAGSQKALEEFGGQTGNLTAGRKLLLRLAAMVTVYGPNRARLEWHGAISGFCRNLTEPQRSSGRRQRAGKPPVAALAVTIQTRRGFGVGRVRRGKPKAKVALSGAKR